MRKRSRRCEAVLEWDTEWVGVTGRVQHHPCEAYSCQYGELARISKGARNRYFHHHFQEVS